MIDEPDAVVVKAFCFRTHNESYVRVPNSDANLVALKAAFGSQLICNLWRHIRVIEGSHGVFSLQWQ
jgi:hypothetical protein